MTIKFGVRFQSVRVGVRSLWRDLRAGELRLLMVAVTLAVGALTAVGFFADRIQSGLSRDARQLLGGDAVLASDQPTPPAVLAQAQAMGLKAVTSIGFPTMARADDAQGAASRLVALKAVEGDYPLRGQMRVAESVEAVASGLAVSTREIPAPGHAWVDAPLLDALGLSVGDRLLLGDSALRIARVIVSEPDRGAGFSSFAPRVMIHRDDLAATGLVQPASRITYRFAVAANDAAITNGDARVARFVTWVREWIEREQVRGARLETVESGRPEMRQTLDRADKFLRLVALLAALLSAVAVALAARGFASRHLDDCAMLRVLGQSQRTLTIAFAVEFLLVGLIASLLGVVLGYAVHHVFVWLLAGLVASQLPPASLWPALLGAGMGMTLLAAFGLPPVLQLARVPALRVMRRDVGQLRPASVAVLAVGVAGFAALLLAASSDLKLGLIAVAGFAVAVLLFAVLGAAAVWLLRRSVNEATAPPWLVLATRQMSARPAYAVVQVSALAAGLLALVLLVLLRTDLIASWQKATPPDAPNRFVINIMPEQASAFRQALDGEGIRGYDWYPMIRGRLIGVNGRSVTPEDFADDRAQRLVDREFNLSHSEQAPAHNEIVAGRWVPGERNAISMEDGIARSLGLKLGDEVRFDIAGVPVDARITSLRKVDWGSLRANFFVMYPVADMGNLPLSYMSAFRAPLARAGERSFDNRLVQAFPNVTNVDMTATLTQVQSVLGQVIRAVEFLFGFTLMAGLVVLFAAVTATREDRAREFAVMRAVGASAALLRQVQRAELAGVGLLAGMLASIVAVAIGWALARYAFEFAWTASWWVVLAGGACGAALALAAGWCGLRDVLRRPVVDTLRRAAQ